MEPLTLVLGLGAAFLALKAWGGKKSAAPAVETASNFDPFPPDQQGPAWYAAISLQWTEIAPQHDAAGRAARTYRGASSGEPAVNRAANDAAFRQLQSQGYRIAANEAVLYGGGIPSLLVFGDGFSGAGLPAELGTLRLLFAPPPGQLGQQDPRPNFPGSVQPQGGEVFDEMPEPARNKARELWASNTASLYELDKTADELDKAGYHASAAALRRRRSDLALARGIEANKRGGWLYVVRQNDLPITVAQWYGGKKPRVLQELANLNPDVAKGGTWKGWIAGEEVLLPATWPDPELKALPPLASGPAPATRSNTVPSLPAGSADPLKAKIAQYSDPSDPRNAAERLHELMADPPRASAAESLEAWCARKLAGATAALPTPPDRPDLPRDPWGADAHAIDAN